MNPIKKWVSAMRLRTLPLALSTSLTGGAMAWGRSPRFWELLGLVVLTTLLLQILSNLANDYGDYVKGTDNEERVGPERALQSGAISKKAMRNAVILFALGSLASGILLLTRAFEGVAQNAAFWIMLGVGLLSVGAAIKYTVGKGAYGYSGLGDLFVFVFFGIVGVAGTFFVITGTWNNFVLLPAAAVGCFSAAVLNLNNMRDHINDAASGKNTLVVKIGLDHAKTYHISLIFAGWACLTALFMHIDSKLMLLIYLPAILFVRHVKFVLGNNEEARFDPELKKIALGTFAFSILFFLVALLS
ncbi:MAG: 1,4-dihydroxy-2-naphthoate octaprenyltransferase [Flavobacteriales bacterium]|nr:1,4-dihydroxy-2-naphthoate octaprenyltransferase [Flavobacteriales bacterium]